MDTNNNMPTREFFFLARDCNTSQEANQTVNMETRILKRKRDKTKESYNDRHSKLYVTLQHSLSSTLEVSGSPSLVRLMKN